MRPIAEIALDLSYSEDKVAACLYLPEKDPAGDWACLFEIGEPISVQSTIYGVSSLQALVLAAKTMAAYLYGSEVYRRKELGFGGEFGGYLGIPAPTKFLDEAPFPF